MISETSDFQSCDIAEIRKIQGPSKEGGSDREAGGHFACQAIVSFCFMFPKLNCLPQSSANGVLFFFKTAHVVLVRFFRCEQFHLAVETNVECHLSSIVQSGAACNILLGNTFEVKRSMRGFMNRNGCAIGGPMCVH